MKSQDSGFTAIRQSSVYYYVYYQFGFLNYFLKVYEHLKIAFMHV